MKRLPSAAAAQSLLALLFVALPPADRKQSDGPLESLIRRVRQPGELPADVFGLSFSWRSSGAYCARSWCVHLPELGGWRSPRRNSEENAGWRHRSFRGYADHMGSDEFAAGLAQLIEATAERPTACMCAEAPWWRCHRRLVADALVAKRGEVCHIGPDGRVGRHEMTEFALVGEGGRVTYPPSGGEQLGLEAGGSVLPASDPKSLLQSP